MTETPDVPEVVRVARDLRALAQLATHAALIDQAEHRGGVACIA